MDVFDLYAKITLDDKEYNRGLDSASEKTNSLGDKIKNGLATAAKIGAAALTGAGTAIIGLGKIGLDYNSQMEQYTTNFTTMLGSQEAAIAKVEELKDFAAKTPFEMSGLASATQTLLAFGVNSEDTMGILKMLGDVSLGNSQKFDSLALVFGQVSSQGKLMGQDLLQMINAGFNPLQVISEHTGESVASLKDKMSEGKITIDDVTQAFKWATQEGGQFYNGMEAGSKTTQGLISTLKDNIQAKLGEAFQTVSNKLHDLLPRAIEFVDSLDVESIVSSVQKLIDAFIKFSPVIAGATAAMIAYKTATAISGVIDALKKATEGQTIAQAALNAVMNANPFVLIATLIAGVVTALVTLGLQSEDFREKIKKVWDAISHPIETIKNIWNDAKNFLSNKWQEIRNAAAEKWQGIKDTISNAVENTKNNLANAWENIKSNLANKWESIRNSAADKWSRIRDAIGNANENIRSKLSSAWETIGSNLGSIWDRIKNNAGTKWSEITSGIQNIFGSLPSKIKEIGKNILGGLWNGIKEKWQEFKDKVSGIVDNIKGLFTGRGGFDSHSPSRWAERLFENVMEGAGIGLDNGKGALFSDVAGIVNDVKGRMNIGALSGEAGYGVGTIGTSNIGAAGESSNSDTITEYNMQVTINLNGSDYTSQRQIAEEISVQLQNLVNRRSAAWA